MLREHQIFEFIRYNDIHSICQCITQFKCHYPNKNFNKEMRGMFNYTALHEAVLWNKFEIVELFIKEGSDPTIRILKEVYKPKGILALYLAENFGKDNITNILKPYTQSYHLNNFYSSILHFTIKNIDNENLKNIYNKISYKIILIFIIRNKLDSKYNIYLPNELVFKILEQCKLNFF